MKTAPRSGKLLWSHLGSCRWLITSAHAQSRVKFQYLQVGVGDTHVEVPLLVATGDL